MKRIAWIVSEGSPGHVSQSVGLVAALGFQSIAIETRPRLGGIARQLVRLWMGRAGRPLSRRFRENRLRCRVPDDAPAPGLIVCSGGKSVFAARSLAAETGAPLVYLGERKPYPSDWFHTVFTPSAAERGANDVPIESIPTKINRDLADAAAAAWTDRPAGPLWAALVGGSSASHRYQSADWQEMAAGMNELARARGIRWLITTSPRTGAEAERILKSALNPAAIAAAVWWSESQDRKMAAFLGAADAVFVTQDSVTMVTEAVASGRPTAVVRPCETHFASESYLPGYFTNLENRGRLKRLPIAALADFQPAAGWHIPRECPVEQELATILLKRLGV